MKPPKGKGGMMRSPYLIEGRGLTMSGAIQSMTDVGRRACEISF